MTLRRYDRISVGYGWGCPNDETEKANRRRESSNRHSTPPPTNPEAEAETGWFTSPSLALPLTPFRFPNMPIFLYLPSLYSQQTQTSYASLSLSLFPRFVILVLLLEWKNLTIATLPLMHLLRLLRHRHQLLHMNTKRSRRRRRLRGPTFRIGSTSQYPIQLLRR
ncbi:hypothetical protein ACLOJK_021535 [Asimina triloba]